MISKRLHAYDALLLVAELQSKAVGITLASPARENYGDGAIIAGLAHISLVAVEPGYWGRGVGRQLVHAALEALRKLGIAVRNCGRKRRILGRSGFISGLDSYSPAMK